MIPRFCLIKIGCNWTREIIKWNVHLMIHRFRPIKNGCNWTREFIKWKFHSLNHSSPFTNLHICIQKMGPAVPAAHRAKKNEHSHEHNTNTKLHTTFSCWRLPIAGLLQSCFSICRQVIAQEIAQHKHTKHT